MDEKKVKKAVAEAVKEAISKLLDKKRNGGFTIKTQN